MDDRVIYITGTGAQWRGVLTIEAFIIRDITPYSPYNYSIFGDYNIPLNPRSQSRILTSTAPGYDRLFAVGRVCRAVRF